MTPARATLVDFCVANDAAAATTKKLEKTKILAEYLRGLSDELDLRRAVRYAGGSAFPSTSERVLGVSGAIVSDVILSMLKLDASEYYEQVVKSGEIGEALAIFWPRREVNPAPEPLTLAEIGDAFDELASTGNQARKREIVRGLFDRCHHPREAAYLAKIIFSDLRTGVRVGVLQVAVAQAFDKPLSQIQQTQLLVGDLDEVAVLARHNSLESAAFHLFHPIQFMLAAPMETAQEAEQVMDGRAFYAEDKLDGIRAQVHKTGDGPSARIAIYTRTMDRTDESFPDVVDQVRKLPGEFLLDGEIVPFRDGRVLPFAHIQKRLGRKQLTAKILRENPAVFIAFDILYRDGELLMVKPLRERRKSLEELINVSSRSAMTNVREVRTADAIERCFCAARDCGNEGLVLKDPDSTYSPGRRGQAWLKIKTHLPTFDCVVTAAEYGHGKRRNTLSDYTFAVWDKDPTAHDDAKLVNIGKAYSGVTDAEIAQLTEIFLKLATAQHGHRFSVEPKIVLEIACDQIQVSNRHTSGYALRFPRIKRIRWDKGPLDAERLSRIVELYQSTANTARREAPEKPAAEPSLFDGLS